MYRNNGFLNFIFACIPGVGYMYNGLLKKGVEILTIFIAAPILLDLFMLGDLIPLVIVPLWFYSFFSTYNIIRRREAGEVIEDQSVLFGTDKIKLQQGNMKLLGVILILVGAFSIASRILRELHIWNVIRGYAAPVVFIILGLYILVKNIKE